MPSKKLDSSESQRDSEKQLTTRFRFPHASTADEDGLVAVGGDLRPGTLVLAYRNGIFPWTTRPITWWSPDPRAVIPLGGLHVSRSLRKVLRAGVFSVTFDRAFVSVMEGCAAPRPGREETWISPEFISAYTRLHEIEHAHSVEIWKDAKLVGGLYGVSIGGLFAGESMYSEEENASKVALVAMEEKLRLCGCALFDVQLMTPHLCSMGAVEIPRAQYLRMAAEAAARDVRFVP
jgi:leucyl/phenylalanyl-tRNA---protein transferase